ncbi:DUF885 family protein [Candidatus Omnitrophota bacterium]
MNSKKEIPGLAREYFSHISSRYPVMCLSDEFYFFPRAKKAREFLYLLDDLDREKINQSTSFVNKLYLRLQNIPTDDAGLETQIDIALLKQSTATFLREFRDLRVWQVNPALYLKIILLGVEQLRAISFSSPCRAQEHLISRIKQIPRLLSQARQNLSKVPGGYLKTSREVANASITYFNNLHFIGVKTRGLGEFDASLRKAKESLQVFNRFLMKKSPSSAFFIKDKDLLYSTLKDSFSCQRSLDEIFQIASTQLRNTKRELIALAKEIDHKKTWQEILYDHNITNFDSAEVLRLYSGQIEKLKDFTRSLDILPAIQTQRVLVKETPLYLRPLRASASYSCPITKNLKEPAFFYVTVGPPENSKTIINSPKRKRTSFYSSVHNEYIFVAAHETYPGHHLLDSIRRKLKNPIRQQIESPLFYEGWASYAERLIDELGYIKSPQLKLLGLKRQAWRAVRAMLDAGIRINKVKLKDIGNQLMYLGYAPGLVKSMLRHYLLTPGYQLCYTIGKFEIEKLKKRFSPVISSQDFHTIVLNSGQIPFKLLEKKLEAFVCKKNS